MNANIIDFRQNTTLGDPVPKKTITKNTLVKRILAYSAIKIRANPPLLYSVLNPDTNSDSPAAKSNGVRLVSARQEANQIKLKGKDINKNKKLVWCLENSSILNPPNNII